MLRTLHYAKQLCSGLIFRSYGMLVIFSASTPSDIRIELFRNVGKHLFYDIFLINLSYMPVTRLLAYPK
jgi:hypothetical protein